VEAALEKPLRSQHGKVKSSIIGCTTPFPLANKFIHTITSNLRKLHNLSVERQKGALLGASSNKYPAMRV